MRQKSTRQANTTRLLEESRAAGGAPEAALEEVVYNELRRMARSRLARERRHHTFQSTDLVHEAFLRLVDQRAGWHNRSHFYAIAARCMRRVVIDRARRRRASKRPQLDAGVDFEQIDVSRSTGIESLLAMDEALTSLERESPRQVQIAELRLFSGFEVAEIADALGISEATVKRDWSAAKRRLRALLTEPA
jgi:RNA polymerase sigma factor (TIGR02999 family)